MSTAEMATKYVRSDLRRYNPCLPLKLLQIILILMIIMTKDIINQSNTSRLRIKYLIQ